MAWMIAAMGAPVNEPRNGELRWPLVPKLTSWVDHCGLPLRCWKRRPDDFESLWSGPKLSHWLALSSFSVATPARRADHANQLAHRGESRCLSNGWHHPTSLSARVAPAIARSATPSVSHCSTDPGSPGREE